THVQIDVIHHFGKAPICLVPYREILNIQQFFIHHCFPLSSISRIPSPKKLKPRMTNTM
ncbi:hypothetical protein PKCEKB_PKCEKB_18700, partial [Dysosmobacter welbionis]